MFHGNTSLGGRLDGHWAFRAGRLRACPLGLGADAGSQAGVRGPPGGCLPLLASPALCGSEPTSSASGPGTLPRLQASVRVVSLAPTASAPPAPWVSSRHRAPCLSWPREPLRVAFHPRLGDRLAGFQVAQRLPQNLDVAPVVSHALAPVPCGLVGCLRPEAPPSCLRAQRSPCDAPAASPSVSCTPLSHCPSWFLLSCPPGFQPDLGLCPPALMGAALRGADLPPRCALLGCGLGGL